MRISDWSSDVCSSDLRPCSHVDQGSISLRRFQQCVYAIPVRVSDDIPLAVEVGKYPLVELGAPAPDHAPEGRDDRQRYDRLHDQNGPGYFGRDPEAAQGWGDGIQSGEDENSQPGEIGRAHV